MSATSPNPDACGICGGHAPHHLCIHCDRPCTGFWCRICADENARYSNL